MAEINNTMPPYEDGRDQGQMGPQTGVFATLRRLFSTDVVIKNAGGKELKVVDSDHIQSNGKYDTNALVDRFNRIYTSGPTSLYGYQSNFNYQLLRPQLYSEYDVMDTDAIVASALDIVADESTLKNDMGEVLQIQSSDDDIQQILYNLFYDILNVEFNMWPWIRNMCKYGDFFLKLEISEKFGVYNVIPYSAFHIERQEGWNRENPSEVRFKYFPQGISQGQTGYYNVTGAGSEDNKNQIILDNYEVAHFRLLTDTNYLPYGRSYLEPGRKLFKQYTLMEDAMLIHRIVRAPEKRIFYINIGNIAPNEVENFMQKVVSKMKRTPYMDQQTGEYNLKYNIQNQLEDFYIPVRGNDAATKIETTKGLEYDGIQDVAYLREKLFAALKVPKAFMGYDENLDGKATLAAQDIRFARTIERIQRIMLSELYKIAFVHLYTLGYRDENLTNFKLSATTPSIIYDQERVALMKEKVDLAVQIKDNNLLPSDWIYENIFHFGEEEYQEYRDMQIEDAKRKFRLSQVEAEGNDPVKTGQSYGTPHDLASLYGPGRYGKKQEVPKGYDEERPEGRPKERASTIGTQNNNFGRDPLGSGGIKNDVNDNGRLNPNAKRFKFNQSEAKVNNLSSNGLFNRIESKKRIILKEEDGLLDENNILNND